MNAPLRKPTKRLRLERPTETRAIEESHSWAVSYADFLMVLLSFFILFFSIDGNKRSDLIDQIKFGGPKVGGADAKSSNSNIADHAQMPAGLSDALKGVDGFVVERGAKDHKLYVHFDDDIYPVGALDLPPAQVKKLLDLLEKFKPYMADLNITFIGHTDDVAFVNPKKRVINNNFALSSMRATKALQRAAQAGFDPTAMYVKGSAENSRSSRTLSILISPREVDQ